MSTISDEAVTLEDIMHEVFKYADIAAPLRGPPMTQDESLPVRIAAGKQDRIIRNMLHRFSAIAAADAIRAKEAQPDPDPILGRMAEALRGLVDDWRKGAEDVGEKDDTDTGIGIGMIGCAKDLERLIAERVTLSVHASDCATHNAPAYPKGPCDCGYDARSKP